MSPLGAKTKTIGSFNPVANCFWAKPGSRLGNALLVAVTADLAYEGFTLTACADAHALLMDGIRITEAVMAALRTIASHNRLLLCRVWDFDEAETLVLRRG